MLVLGSLAVLCHVFLTWRACAAKGPVVKAVAVRGAGPAPSRWPWGPSEISGGARAGAIVEWTNAFRFCTPFR